MNFDAPQGNRETPIAEIGPPPFSDDNTPPPMRQLEIEAPREASATKVRLLDQAYQDYCSRVTKGEPVDPDAFCAEFPHIQSSLCRLLHTHLLLEEHPEAFAELPDELWPQVGTTFLDYDLKLQLGKGAFARVFLATEPKLGDRLVAIKVAVQGGAEANVLGRIQHPNIVPIHSITEDPQTRLTAVCMPYLGSATLLDVLDRAFQPSTPARRKATIILDAAKDVPYPLDPAQPVAIDPVLQKGSYVDGIRLIGAKLADALALIHDRGIFHFDLKPSNVLLTPEGEPMLLDFNLCAGAGQAPTRLGGTLQYMSPEQLGASAAKDAEAAAALDARSDIFSLGVILYQLVTGVHPFGPLPLKLTSVELHQHLVERHPQAPVEARQLNPNVDDAFSQLIQRCLAFDPKDRPQSATEIATALRPKPTAPPIRKSLLARHPRKMLVAAVLVLVLGVVGVAVAMFRPPFSQRQLEAGLELHQQGRYAEAVEHFNNALQADPASHRARFARGHAHQQLGMSNEKNYNLAMQDYLMVDQERPDARCKAGLGYCLNRTAGVDREAVLYYSQAIDSGFANAEVYNNRGYSQMKVKQWVDAKQSLDRAIELDPKLAAAYHNRALVAYAQTFAKLNALKPGANPNEAYRGLEPAIADIKQAIDLGAASAELHLDAAKIYAVAARSDHRRNAAVLHHMEHAVALGCDGRGWNDLVFDPVRNMAPFQELVKRSQAGQPLPPTRRIVDPIKNVAL